MLSPELTDDELRDEERKARYMAEIADTAGEADASALWASVVRSIETEQQRRAAA
ncbi:MAG: hypothetical protein ACJ8DZ_14175 [Allosphingosinicella sp.]